MLDIIRDKAQSFGVKLIFGIIIVVFVFWVGALYICNGVVGAKTCKRVDMAVGIIATKIAVVKPQHLSGFESFEQVVLYVSLVKVGVAVRVEQTLACSEKSAVAIALDASAFQHESLLVLVFAP